VFHWQGGRADFSDHWITGVFDKRLGAPVADATYHANTGRWERAFKTVDGALCTKIFALALEEFSSGCFGEC
jgi:hypothetical protein